MALMLIRAWDFGEQISYRELLVASPCISTITLVNKQMHQLPTIFINSTVCCNYLT
jgi:hypothetical protein